VIDPAALPSPGRKRVAVRVTKDALRRLRGGHPWVYEGSVTSVSHDAAPGDLAVVFDERRRFAAIGLWDPGSPIRIRVLHAGAPTPIDSAFLLDRIRGSVQRRRPLLDAPEYDACRLVHGENDGLPGLVVDLYRDIVVLKPYTDAWVPHLRSVLAAVEEVVDGASVVLRLARSVSPRPDLGLVDGATLVGADPAEPVIFTENGLHFEASPTRGQKTGTFLDQRDNRARVRDLAAGARVLDVFSCTGGFGVHAAAGGARAVTCVDLSRPALDTARRNLAHNRPGVPTVGELRTVRGDAFAVMDDLIAERRRFDLVVVDPPSFTPRRTAVPRALDAYRRLTRRAVRLTEPGGTLVQASCSARVPADRFHALVHDAAATQGVTLREIARTGHPLDHPIGFPEGAYLKALFATVEH
jgi:23S rRNA (cytosine1962-C5)-methyltransferase